ncbi:MAG: aldo/keto reductase [Candidatus Bathyarchaeota archaeon]|jgi:predicted aldo/keto reductase-like oxidoreductase|nr:aldo/keto reductase [Candidatus Termiticorpusculum sp.]MCL1971022.1 aldo/keto reductase [Candidatus Termiticorpusculum sp.]
MQLQTRRLGRTNLNVSIVGFGGTWISEIDLPTAVDVVRRAFELGINYFDTARWDGDSEAKIGCALKDTRDKCIIATKTGSRTKAESIDDLKRSLQLLQTDHVDIIQLHGIDDEKTLAKAMSSDGALQTCKQAQKKKLANFIGITGHKPQILAKAIETGEFDMVLVPLNIITRQAEEELLPIAKDLDVGVIAMKPLSAKTSNLITCTYQPSLSLVSDEPELKDLLGQNNAQMVNSLLRCNLSKSIASTIVGLRSILEVETAANAGTNYQGLTDIEQKRFNFKLDTYCRDCGLCMSCPEKINIPAILRFYTFYSTYGLKNWARKLYTGLEVKSDKCTKCDLCQQKCPYNLPIEYMLKEAHKNFVNSSEINR